MKNAIFIFFLAAISSFLYSIQVSGNQSGTWTPDNNPYEVIGDVTVPSGLTLTVQPGVAVHAMGLYQIIAEGNIIANGTETDSIYFVSGQTDPAALWDGIRLESESVQSQFSYCRIDNGDYGINSINSPASITYCHFKNNKRGIQAYAIGSIDPAVVLIDHNLIEWTIQNAILIAQNSNALITNNDITLNGTSASYYGAVQLSNQSANGSNNPEIAYNHIHHNFKQGIIAWDIVSANAIMPEVHHNLVENNLTGIYFRNSNGYLHHNTVINNFIPGDMNSGAGIMVSGATGVPYFEDNIVTGNYTGFYLTENAQPCIGNMQIFHAWAQGNNTIANNIDANNVMHSIYCYNYTNSALTVFAENNFWDYNTAVEIAGTIEDHNDNASLPTVDFDPWQNNPIPIYLAGTVTLANPPVLTATLELVSAHTGNVLNTWEVNINEPFQVPVYHDSLVYIVAHTTDDIENIYYGAYGGTDNPISTQIVADVTFNIGELPVSTPPPNWSYRKIGGDQMVGGHMSNTLKVGWFVYAPTEIYNLFRDGNFLRLCWVEAWQNEQHYSFSVPGIPVWMRIDSLDTVYSWDQCYDIDYPSQEVNTIQTRAETGITTFQHDEESTYDLVLLGDDFRIDLFDNVENVCRRYWYRQDMSYCLAASQKILPVLVEPDGTLFPLVEGNFWKAIPDTLLLVPSYFGYKAADSLSFYWVPPGFVNLVSDYRIYDNGTLIASLPLSQRSMTIPIPADGIEHTYTLSRYYNNTDHFSPSDIVLTFTSNQDEVQPTVDFSVYPNPFNPAGSALTLKYGFSGTEHTRIDIYNLKGQKVWSATLVKGSTEIHWDGRDKRGRLCASGLYQVRITEHKGKSVTRKLMLIH